MLTFIVMYKHLSVTVIILTLLNSVFSQQNNPCGEMKPNYMEEFLGEAVYDNFRRTEIKYSENPYEIEYQVDLLKNFVYKLVFDMSDKSEG